ncbi:MAG: thioredoxin family protein [Bacteroidota bacterium]
MHNDFSRLIYISFLVTLLFGASSSSLSAGENDLTIIFHPRGVIETNITLLPLSGPRQFKSLAELKSVKSGQTAVLTIPGEYLPGEFVIRFDYREKQESTPYPSEKHILIGNQPLELWVHPMFANNPDSTWFSKSETENAAFALFSKENGRQKEKIGLLHQFLMAYDNPESDFYRQGIHEYNQRRQAYNVWLEKKTKEDKALFASSLYRFSYLPEVAWTGTEQERISSMISHYFDGIDLNDPIITKTSQLNEWMNNFVNLHGQMATSVALRDSLFPAAAKSAIEKAKKGHPQVYGWMVDYFYRGFESNNLPQGMKVLEPYLNDPACLTTKRMEIERRLNGMKTLVTGAKAPDFLLFDGENNPFQLYHYSTPAKYTLLLFWSADCSHCAETIHLLHPWSQQPDIRKRISVIAISLDETSTEIDAWKNKIKNLSGWKHLRANEGINSKVANDYYILATPVMILLNAETGEIAATPDSFSALSILIK